MDPVEIHEERIDTGVPVNTVPVQRSPAYSARTWRTEYRVGWRSVQVVWFIAGVINAILALDFGFRLLRANVTGFVTLVYGLADIFASPFDGIFRQTVARGQFIVRWADVLGIAIYSLIAYGIARLIRINARRPRDTVPPA